MRLEEYFLSKVVFLVWLEVCLFVKNTRVAIVLKQNELDVCNFIQLLICQLHPLILCEVQLITAAVALVYFTLVD